MVRVIIINGPGGSGKDRFIGFVDNVLRRRGIKTYNISSVDPVKALAKEMGWSGAKNEQGRKLLADLKRLWTDFNDGPNRYLSEQVAAIESGVVFLHIREPEEIGKFVRSHPGTVTLHLSRGVGKLGNAADDGTEGYEYSYRIVNDGSLADLARKAKEFINELCPAG